MTNSYDVDHGLSQCHPGALEPVEIAQQDDTQAPTGNTTIPAGWRLVPIEPTHAMVIEGLNAGLEHKDEPYFIYAAMLNAAPASPAPASSAEPIPKAIARTIHRALVAFSDAELARLRNLQTPEKSASNLYGAGRLAAQQNIDDVDAALNWLAAPVAAQAPRPCTCHPDDRPDGPCREKYAASECQAPAAASDALDAARYRKLRRKVCIAGGQFHILNLAPTYVAPDAAVELDSVLDAAIAAQQGEGGEV